MAWTATEHPQEFLDSAGPFLRARATSNTIILTASEGLVARGGPLDSQPALFGWWHGDGAAGVTGAFIHTPPYPLHFSALPGDALEPLADLLVGVGRELAGVNAGTDLAVAFAAAWRARCGDDAHTSMRTRLYRLGTLRPSERPPGHAVVASQDDRGLLIGWVEAFGAEIAGWRENVTSQVEDRLASGAYTIWQDDDGTPVALAGLQREVGGSRRIGPVYTCKPHRGKGYGAAVTAAACRRAMNEGAAELLLFADVDNPASNRLYQRLGFEPIEDLIVLRFKRPG
ncbi:MAG: GNAT family N-acetyltransferase [Solirubrobacterales bacterium]|jgi:RimJ/RimL family protein N-acetyltransferase|nr:GNAT family N-acetyltransferase [Solirubrobacterales bacterium]